MDPKEPAGDLEQLTDAAYRIFLGESLHDTLQNIRIRLSVEFRRLSPAYVEDALSRAMGAWMEANIATRGVPTYKQLYVAAHGYLLNELRHSRREVAVDPSSLDQLEGGPDPTEASSNRADIAVALGSNLVTHRTHDVVLLWWEGFSHKEIGQRLNLKISTVRKKLQRGLARLLKFLRFR